MEVLVQLGADVVRLDTDPTGALRTDDLFLLNPNMVALKYQQVHLPSCSLNLPPSARTLFAPPVHSP